MKKLYKYLFLPLFAFCIWSLQKNDSFFSPRKTSNKLSTQTTIEKKGALLPDSTAIRDIRNVIASREYHITYDDQTRSFQSPNRRQNLRATYEPGALTIRKRVDSTHSGFTVKLLNKGVFADDQLLYAVASESAVTHSENKVVIDHGHFSEEFINSEEGIRQNFVVAQAPEGVKSLEVKLAVSGATVRDSGHNELHFVTGTGEAGREEELVYNGLKCWDADGKILDATLAYTNNQIEIKVGVANASFPVTIDPLTNSGPVGANKMLEIHQYYAWMGYSVSSAGDVNGDGFSDAVVGIPGWEISKWGAIAVYYGQAAGLQESSKQFHYGLMNDRGFGTSVSGAGDLNGDGYSDLIVGAPAHNSTQTQYGRFAIILGNYPGANGPGTVTGWAAVGAATMDQMGTSVSGAGDVNGDRFSDIIVGIPGYDTPTAQDAGRIRTYFGGGEFTAQNESLLARRANLTLYNAGTLTPYAPAHPGQDAETTFDLNLIFHSFLGRNKGKIVWETKMPAQPFSKVGNTSIANSVQYTGSMPAYEDFGPAGMSEKKFIASVTKLSAGTKVRARVKFDPVLAITGQMYGPWRYPSALVSGKSVAPPPQEIASSLRVAAEIAENAQESVSIYPNPASERLFIRSNSQNAITGIKLVTAGGTIIYNTGKAQTEIDLKGVAPGMYVLVTKHADGSELSHKVAVRK